MKVFMFHAVRHGETIAGSNDIILGQNDSPLSDKGKMQAADTAIKLPKIDILISSSMGRAVETATIISNALNIKRPILKMDEFQERNYGVLQGKTKEIIALEFPFIISTRDDILNPKLVPGIEPYDNFLGRISRGIEKIREAYGESKIVLVTHGGVIRAIYAITKANCAPRVLTGSIHEFRC